MDDNSIKYGSILASHLSLFLLISYILRVENELITIYCAVGN